MINASWGGGFSQTVADAIADAHAAGVVFVAAAGNSAADVDSGVYPAADRNAITVSAFDHLDQRASFSNYGAKIDVAAPGGGDAAPPKDNKIPIYSILSLHSSAIAPADDFESFLILAQPEGEYLRLAGTSMAAPHVSGVAALLLAHDPSLTVEQVRQLLRTTADDVGRRVATSTPATASSTQPLPSPHRRRSRRTSILRMAENSSERLRSISSAPPRGRGSTPIPWSSVRQVTKMRGRRSPVLSPRPFRAACWRRGT